MKQTQRSVLVATLLLLYGMGMGMFHSGFAWSQGDGFSHATAAEYQAALTTSIVYQIAPSDATVSGSLHVPYHTLKDGSKYIASVLPLFNTGLQHAFRQLQQQTVGLRINLRKTDLLFPVHFFW